MLYFIIFPTDVYENQLRSPRASGGTRRRHLSGTDRD